MRRLSYVLCALAVSAVGLTVPQQAAQAATSNVVARWDLNEGSGATVAADSSGNGLNGAIDPDAAMYGLHTGVTDGTSTFYRWDNRCPACEPANPQRVVKIPDSDLLDVTDASMTWQLEFRFRTTRPFGNFMQKGQSASRGGQIKVQAPGGIVQCLFKGEDGTRVGTGSDVALDDGQWHTVQCIRTETQVKEFVDGVRVQIKNGSTGVINNKKPFTIGGKTECDQIDITCDYFVGDIDYVTVSNDAGPAGNVPPVAKFGSDCTNLSCAFDSTGTTDSDGSITGYDWDFGDGTAHSSAANPPHTFATGGKYTVTLTVTDNLGDTDKAVHPVTVESGAVPTKPRNPAAASGDAAATVTWSTPSSEGDSPITDYTVTSNPGGKTCTTTAPTLTCTVHGLTNGQAYTFTIVALSDVGTSPPSNETAAVTPAGKPLAPANAQASAGNHRATVSWASASANGSPLTGYVITTLPGGVTTTVGATATSTVVKGLTNGTVYHFTVAATNAVGTGSARTTNEVRPAGYPHKVANVHATAKRHAARVAWTAANGNGAKVLHYRIETSTGRHLVVGPKARSVLVKQLKSGSKVRFRVQAVNRVGAGAWSAWSARVTVK